MTVMPHSQLYSAISKTHSEAIFVSSGFMILTCYNRTHPRRLR